MRDMYTCWVGTLQAVHQLGWLQLRVKCIQVFLNGFKIGYLALV